MEGQTVVPASPPLSSILRKGGGPKKEHANRRRRRPATLSIRQTTHGVTIFTTGQVAKMFGVAPRTVTKWADTNKFPGTYHIPGSRDRRIPLTGVIEFVENNPPGPPGLLDELRRLETGMKDPSSLAASLFLPAGWLPGVETTDLFEVGLRLSTRTVKILVFGCEYGLAHAAEACKKVVAVRPDVLTGIVLGDDRFLTDVPADVFSAVFKQANGPEQVKEWISSAYEIRITGAY